MTLARQVEQAASRLETAQSRLQEARDQAPTPDNLERRIAALDDCVTALIDIQSFNVESIHEKLHDIAARLQIKV